MPHSVSAARRRGPVCMCAPQVDRLAGRAEPSARSFEELRLSPPLAPPLSRREICARLDEQEQLLAAAAPRASSRSAGPPPSERLRLGLRPSSQPGTRKAAVGAAQEEKEEGVGPETAAAALMSSTGELDGSLASRERFLSCYWEYRELLSKRAE